MKTVSLSGSLRENVGKKEAKKLRKENLVPCVIYGGEKQLHFSLTKNSFKELVFTPEAAAASIELDGKEYLCLLQDIQYHPVSDEILHADFIEVIEGKEVIMSIPIAFEGSAPGILKGGRLFKPIRKVKLRGLLNDIPELFTVNISELEITQSIKIMDCKLDKITFLDPPSSIIVSIKTARGAAEDEEEEGEEGSEEESTEESTEE